VPFHPGLLPGWPLNSCVSILSRIHVSCNSDPLPLHLTKWKALRGVLYSVLNRRQDKIRSVQSVERGSRRLHHPDLRTDVKETRFDPSSVLLGPRVRPDSDERLDGV
jgi:hypothetical protein